MIRCFLITLVLLTPLCLAETIWIEAESSTDSSVIQDAWYNDADPSLLSNGKWLSHFGDSPGIAKYAFTTKSAGYFRLWVRVNPEQSSIRYQINNGSWQTIISFKSAYDKINVAADKKDDFRYLAWTDIGRYNLPAGENKIVFKFNSEKSNHGALDCFCLTTDSLYLPTKSRTTSIRATKVPADAIYPAPIVNQTSFDDWIKFIEPTPKEMMWRTHIRWHHSLADAVVEAKKLRRPILLWTMNGHPSGET